MHPDLETTLRDLDEASKGWNDLTRGLSNEQANWRPAPERWSIAQCMDHLNETTGKLVPAMERAMQKRIESPGPYHYGFIGRWFLRSLAPEGAKPLKVPPAYRPSSSALDIAAVANRFRETHDRFRRAIVAADGLDLSRIRVASPALAALRLQLGIWFLSTGSHLLRHLNQARRVRSDARFPS